MASPSASSDRYTLYGAPGSGATPIHAALTLIGAQVDTVDMSPWEGESERERVAGVNPMRQVPALVLPSGELMTESAAILIWLGDRYPETGLCPAPDDPRRARDLRWMVYLPAAIYSLFWVRDDPARLTPDAAAQPAMLERTAERIAHCWHLMDTQIDEPAPSLPARREDQHARPVRDRDVALDAAAQALLPRGATHGPGGAARGCRSPAGRLLGRALSLHVGHRNPERLTPVLFFTSSTP